MTEQTPRGRDQAPTIESFFKFTYSHRVRYDEVDAQGVTGNATWIDLVQLGRIEYLRYLGLLMEGGSRAPVQVVVRRSVVDFLAPARFDDPLVIRVRCSQIGNRSAKFETIIDNVETALRLLVAETVVVCLEMAHFKSAPWPRAFAERISELEGKNVQIGQG